MFVSILVSSSCSSLSLSLCVADYFPLPCPRVVHLKASDSPAVFGSCVWLQNFTSVIDQAIGRKQRIPFPAKTSISSYRISFFLFLFCVITLNCFHLLCCQDSVDSQAAGEDWMGLLALKNTWDLDTEKTESMWAFFRSKKKRSEHPVMTGISTKLTMWIRNSQDEVSVAAIDAHDCRDRMCVNDWISAGKSGNTNS